ncbi:MAG: acyl-CoA thioesterase [Polyangiales bacterium]|nr:acyl-CoA thioesterase [Myxococcales bacterium]MCB9657589.1 acyl-CoA thioesterase [Sandaracinaceae bacterium]
MSEDTPPRSPSTPTDAHAASPSPTGRPPSDSYTEMTEMVLPQHTNVVGTAFGGVIMSWVDICAAIAAQRHCGEVAVTARVDAMEFHAPIRLGDVVCLRAQVNAAFGSSMEVGVLVEREDRRTRERTKCVESFLTFVNVIEGRPRAVPRLLLSTEDERRREQEAHARRAQRLAAR